jgi:hypothetical protein
LAPLQWDRYNPTQLPKSGSLDPRLKSLRWTSWSPKSPRISKNHQTSLNITQKSHSTSQRNHPNISRSSSNSDPFRPLELLRTRRFDRCRWWPGAPRIRGATVALWRTNCRTSWRSKPQNHGVESWSALVGVGSLSELGRVVQNT